MTASSSKPHRWNFFARILTVLPSLLAAALWCLLAVPAIAGDTALPGCPALSDQVGCGGALPVGLAAAPNGGFWIQITGKTIAVGGAPEFESVNATGAIATIPGRNGYWVISTNGVIYPRGAAPEICGGNLAFCSRFRTGAHIIMSAASTPDGQGFWALDDGGAVWTAGTAKPYGDVTSQRKNSPAETIAATPSGNGYVIALENGAVYSFGDAPTMPSNNKQKNIRGMALSLDAAGQVNGYWLVDNGGGVYSFGNAIFLGSTGGKAGKSAVANIAALPYARGYAWVHFNGGIGYSRTFTRATIQSSTLDAVWGLPYDSKQPVTPVVLFPPSGDASQQWDFWPASADGKVVQLVNVNSRLCADLTSVNLAVFMIQYPCKARDQGWDNQRFVVTSNGNLNYFTPVPFPDYRVAGFTIGSGLIITNDLDRTDLWSWILTGLQSSQDGEWPMAGDIGGPLI